MRSRLLAALIALSSIPAAAGAPKDAEAAYQEARTGYYALKGDEARRKFRHNWLPVIQRFERVASRFPKSDRAPDALFTAAQTLEELSQISRLDEDLSAAMSDYEKLSTVHPKHKLADDAAYLLARIQRDRLGRMTDARKTALHALEKLPKGDRAKDLKALAASIPDDSEPARNHAAAHSNETALTVSGEPSPHSRLALVEAIEKLARSQAPLYQQKPEVPAEMEAELQPELVPSKPAVDRTREDTQRRELAVVDPKLARARLKGAVQKDSEITLAEQLGLKVRRVIIDPGHGGHDSGAVGAGGAQEKDVALSISKKLAKELQRAGLEVVLTRDDDAFVRLEDRAGFANSERGDLFISVHCNSAAKKKLRGIEVYTLNTSADRYSIRLAARENASSEKSISDLQFILADLATRANTEESSNLAEEVQRNLVTRLSSKYKNIRDLGHKQALFYVLLGTRMPAILVETSFLSNPEEETRLQTAEYQDAVAASIAAGVSEFLGNREKIAKVD